MSTIEHTTAEAKRRHAIALSAPIAPDTVVTTRELASWLGLSNQAITVLADRGIITRIAHGEWPLKATMLAIVRHYRAVASGRGNGENGALGAARARLAAAQAEKVERENSAARGELAPVAEIISHLQVCNRMVVSRILGIGPQHAPEIAACREAREVQVLLDRLLREALEGLCQEIDVSRAAEAEARKRKRARSGN